MLWVRRIGWGGLPLWIALALWANRAWQRHDAERLLARAVSAPSRLSYQATAESRFGYDGKVLRSRVLVTHEAPDRTRWDYLGPDLAGTCAVTVGERTWRYDPQIARTELSTTSAVQLPSSTRGYRVRTGPGEPIANHSTTRVQLSVGRYRRELWLDRESGLVLRSRVSQPTGGTVETTFVSLTFGPPARPVSFDAPSGETRLGAEPMDLAGLREKLHANIAEPAWLPDGFRPAGTYLYHCPCCDMVSAQLVYTDGTAWVSLFEGSKSDAGCMVSGQCCATAESTGSCVGATRDEAMVVGRLDHDPVVMAMGDLPQAVLARMVESVP